MSGTPPPDRLSDVEIGELLRRPVLARLATIRADGYPSIVPVWIDWDDAAAWIVARARAAFVGDIRRDPRVCLSVVDDRDPDRRAQLFGRAELVGQPGPLSGRTLEIARRMAQAHEGAAGLAYVEGSVGWPRQLIRIQPARVVSWRTGAWHPKYTDGPTRGQDPQSPGARHDRP